MANEKTDPARVGLQIDAPTPNPSPTHHKGHYTDGGVQPTLNLPQPLSLEEKKYLLSVERGDLPNVRRILQKAHRKQHINVNCMDPLGRRALTLAIDSENLEMVELLIIMGVDTKDSLLQAINAEFVEAVELLLEHEELIHTEGEPYSWQKVDINTAMFSPDVTPLILAAHKNNFEILKMLLDRGAAVPIPHDIRCGCEDCVRMTTEDALRLSLARVNVYKALASPSLISLTSADPILTTFQLSWELRNLAFTEQECKSEYMQLRQQCRNFAVELLSKTRNSQELAIILNQDPDSPSYEEGDRMTLARLVEAIKYKQKKFVAHPNVQQLLASIWYEGVPGFRRKSNIAKVLTIAKVAILFPLYCLVYMIAPNCNTGKLMRKPFMKFLIHASSYLFFLFILILVSQRAEDNVIELFGTDVMRKSLEQRLQMQRGNGPTMLELLVTLFVLGFVWEEIQEIYTVGIKDYLRNMWNFIDFTRNTLYVSVGCLRVFAYIQQRTEIAQDPATAFIPREEWDDFDPQLIAEGLFAAANIFSALKLVHLFSINPHLGPLQISLGRMVIDIVKFFFIYSLVLFAFACGLNQLLWYFANLEKRKCYSLPDDKPDWAGNGDACMKWRRFGNLFESSQSLFWASFGMVGLGDFELEGIKSYTRFWGLLMFGSYSVINVIVLLNLLIAMMSNSYAMIDEHSDTEWKFARTKLWMSYFEDSATLPPPFNIFPSIKWIIRIFRKSKKEIARKITLKRKEIEQENRYTAIMRALVWRYVSHQHRKCDEDPVTEDDINEVKSDISSMRFELLEIFERNGMDVSSAAKKEKPVRARRTKIWERRLMKDFQVAPAPADCEETSEEPIRLDEPPPPNETPKSKFRRIARQIASDSVAHKWNVVLTGVAKNSQIGKCNNRQSFKNQQNLYKAIEEAKRLVLMSPPPVERGETPIEFVDDTSTTLVDLLNTISAEVEKVDETSSFRFGKLNTSPLRPNKNQSQSSAIKSTKSLKIQTNNKPISPPPMFSNNNHNNNDNTDSGQQQSQKPVPEIKVTSEEPMILSAANLLTLKAPPPPAKVTKKAPPPPPTRNDECRAPPVKRTAGPSELKKADSIPDSFEPHIIFMDLNDSTEQLVPRPFSPESDTSSIPPNSPRLNERLPDVTAIKRRGGWL